jgi:hypothetical protein
VQVFTYLLTFAIVLGCGVITKGLVLLMASQLKAKKTLPLCTKDYSPTLREYKFTIHIIVISKKNATLLRYVSEFLSPTLRKSKFIIHINVVF